MQSLTAAAVLVSLTVALTACEERGPTSPPKSDPSFNFENAPENTGMVHRYDNVTQGLSFCADGYCAYHGIDPADACAGNWWNDPLWDFQVIENPADVENWVSQANDVHVYIWPVWWDCDYMLSHGPVAAGFGNFRGHHRWRDGVRYQFKWKAQGQLTTQTEHWVEYPANGHWYAVTSYMNWLDAEDLAVSWGGHLLTLNDADEELWIKDTFGRDVNFWLGFNDIEEEGTWVWVSGEPVTYTNWDAGQPGDDHGGEDVAVMNHGVCPPCIGDYWHDWPRYATTLGIVERSTEPSVQKLHYNGRSSWVRDANGNWHVNRFIKLQ